MLLRSAKIELVSGCEWHDNNSNWFDLLLIADRMLAVTICGTTPPY